MKRPFFGPFLAASLLASVLGAPRAARAGLTDSERAQLRQVVVSAELERVGKARALTGRPDLTVEESTSDLVEAMRATEFDGRHETFFRELLLGPASEASRSSLVPPVVAGLLARVEAVLAAHPNDLAPWMAAHPRALGEVLRIHAFIDRYIANIGHPPEQGHDAGAAITDDAFRRAALAYRAHVEHAPRVYKFDALVRGSALPSLRAQAAVTLFDLGSGLWARDELADWLGLASARKVLFVRAGTLVADGAGVSPERVDQVVRAWGGVPCATRGVELLLVDKPPTSGLSARGIIARARVHLSDELRPSPKGTSWPASATVPEADAPLAEVAWEAARLGTPRALQAKPALEGQATKALERARAAGAEGYLAVGQLNLSLDRKGASSVQASPATLVTHSVRLLLIDAPRALEAALSRALGGRTEPLEQLLLALSVMTTPESAQGPSADVASAGATSADGSVRPALVSSIHAAASGLVDAFVLDGHKIEVEWTAAGGLTNLRRDGRPASASTSSGAPAASELDGEHATLKNPIEPPGGARAMTDSKLRILVAKPGLDGHDRGAKVVARALRDAGFEVIYTGLHQTPEMIAVAAVQEDVDAVGLSIMSGAHNTLFPAVIEALRAKGADDIVVFGGGIVPDDDLPKLYAAGVKGVFTPGTTLAQIVEWVHANVKPRAA